jgi:hypothetical protein
LTLEPAALLALRFVLDERGRMIGTNEPLPERAPRMTMIRSATSCSWTLRVDIDDAIADRTVRCRSRRRARRDTARPHRRARSLRYIFICDHVGK